MATFGKMLSFSSTNISENKSKYASISDCLGVDYFHTREEVSTSRATDMRNLIHVNGHNEKRNGYKQICDTFETNLVPNKINGIWELKTSYARSDGELYKFLLVQEGTQFAYKNITDGLTDTFGNNNSDFTTINITNNTSKTLTDYIRNEKSFGVIRGNRLYILCGMYLVFGVTYDSSTHSATPFLKTVENDSETYIPTTTIGIGCQENDLDEIVTRVTLDEPNLLTQRRINQIVGNNLFTIIDGFSVDPSVYQSATQVFTYRVGRRIDKYKYNDLYNHGIIVYINCNKKINFTINSSGVTISGYTYNNPNSDATLESSFEDWLSQNTDLSSSDTTTIATNLQYFHISAASNIVSFYICSSLVSVEIIKVSFITNLTSLTFALDTNIDSTKTVTLNGTDLTLSTNYTISGSSITLLSNTFTYFNDPLNDLSTNELIFYSSGTNNADLINKCRFGCLYQYNELGQLFVSGNDEYPNYDWHSSDRYYNESQDLSNLSEYEDLTYFGSESYYMLGAANTKITGYNLLSDSTLAIHKEYSPVECCMYLRKPTTTSITLADGETTMYKLEYTQHPTNIKEGAISFDTIANLYNDNLFLSSNGLYAIQITENVLSDVRIAVERSTIVNNKLTKEDFTNATAIVYDNRYYLSLNDDEGKVYVADARFRSKISDEMADTLSYEFWIWDNIQARVWSVIDDELFFGTNDGRICRFTDDYEDYTFDSYNATMSLEGETGSAVTTTKFSVSVAASGKIAKGDEIKFVYPSNSSTRIYRNLFKRTISQVISYSNRLVLTNKEIEKEIQPLLVWNETSNDYDPILVSVINGSDASNYKLKYTSTGVYFLDTDGSEESITATPDNVLIVSVVEEDIKKVLSFNSSTSIMTIESCYYIESNGAYEYEPEDYLYDSGNISFREIYKTPVKSYWITPSLNMGLPNYLKKTFNLTLVPSVFINSEIKVTYQTHSKYGVYKNAIQTDNYAEGSNYVDFTNLDFNTFTFRTNEFSVSYNKHKIIQDFNYIQFLLENNSNTNFAFSEFDIEYKIIKKAKGVK